MNITWQSYGTYTANADKTQTYSACSFKDSINNGKYNRSSVKVGQKVYGYYKQSMKKTFGVWEIVKKENVSGKINITLQCIHPDNGVHKIETSYLPVFICDTDNFIDDIPNGSVGGFSPALTDQARTYNLLHQPKSFVDEIDVNDIITDTSIEDTTKQHYAELKHTPLVNDVVYMGINGVNYYESADDMEIDRKNKRIYFDTQKDDFSFDDLAQSATKIRVFYHYID